VLVTGKSITDHQEQQLAVAMERYLNVTREISRPAGAIQAAIREAGAFLRAELNTLNSPLATKRYIRREHKRTTGMDIGSEELEAELLKIRDTVRNNEGAGYTLRNHLLADSVYEQFMQRHEKSIDTVLAEVNAAAVPPSTGRHGV